MSLTLDSTRGRVPACRAGSAAPSAVDQPNVWTNPVTLPPHLPPHLLSKLYSSSVTFTLPALATPPPPSLLFCRVPRVPGGQGNLAVHEGRGRK